MIPFYNKAGLKEPSDPNRIKMVLYSIYHSSNKECTNLLRTLPLHLPSACRLSQPASLAPLATRLNAIHPLRLPSPPLTCLRVSAIEDTVSRGVAKETVSSRCCCFVWLRNVSPCRPVVLPIHPQHRLFVCSARHASSSSHTAHTTRRRDAKEAFHLSVRTPP